MNKNYLQSAAVVLGMAVCGSVSAANNVLQARWTPLGVGDYDIELRDATSTAGIEGDYFTTDLGFTFIHALDDGTAWIADTEVEYFKVSTDNGADFDRTDIKFTAGYKTAMGLTPFAGFRKGLQGDGAFNDDAVDENGFFLGLSMGGLQIGDAGTVTLSAAYNQNEYEIQNPVVAVDTKGISLRAGFLLSSIPLGFNLKYQSFSEDEDIGVSYDEDYLTLNATWYFWSHVLGQ